MFRFNKTIAAALFPFLLFGSLLRAEEFNRGNPGPWTPKTFYSPVHYCFRILGAMERIARGEPWHKKFINSMPKAMYYQLRSKYVLLQLLKGKIYNPNDPLQKADLLDWISEQPELFNQPFNPSQVNYDRGHLRSRYYESEEFKAAARNLRQNGDGVAPGAYLDAQMDKIIKGVEGDSEPMAQLWAMERLSQKREKTPEQKELAKAYGESVREDWDKPSRRLFEPDVPDNTQIALKNYFELIDKYGSNSKRILKRYLATQPPSLSKLQAQDLQRGIEKQLVPELLLEVPPEVLLGRPSLLQGLIPLHTSQSDGLVKAPRIALRSRDGKFSITYQQLPDGTLRVEGFRVLSENEPPVPFVYEKKAHGPLTEENTRNEINCFSCHGASKGKIEIKGSLAQEAIAKMARATARVSGRPVADPPTLHPMKKIAAGSAEEIQLREWQRQLRN